jgi:hypothetical protein
LLRGQRSEHERGRTEAVAFEGKTEEGARVAGLGLSASYLKREGALHGSHPITLWRTWHGWMSCRIGKKKRREWEVGFGEARWAVGASLLLLFF